MHKSVNPIGLVHKSGHPVCPVFVCKRLFKVLIRYVGYYLTSSDECIGHTRKQ